MAWTGSGCITALTSAPYQTQESTWSPVVGGSSGSTRPGLIDVESNVGLDVGEHSDERNLAGVDLTRCRSFYEVCGQRHSPVAASPPAR